MAKLFGSRITGILIPVVICMLTISGVRVTFAQPVPDEPVPPTPAISDPVGLLDPIYDYMHIPSLPDLLPKFDPELIRSRPAVTGLRDLFDIPAKVLEALSGLRHRRQFTVSIQRAGLSRVLSYRVMN